MSNIETIQLREFCRLFEVEPREVRYILESGFVPDGVRRTPSTGNRREFAPDQAFWLAIVLKLKHVGLKTSLAAQVSDYATDGLRGITQNLSWDWEFLPHKGWFDTKHQYFVDIGDLQYIRLLTDACPTRKGLYEFDWHPVEGPRAPLPNVRPFVTLRVDLTLISNVLKKVEAWSQPDYTKRTQGMADQPLFPLFLHMISRHAAQCGRRAKRVTSLRRSFAEKTSIRNKNMSKNRKHPSGAGGPKTKAGKEASRRNALKHGLTARKLLPAALDKERVNEHRNRFQQQFRPANATESILVAEMARHAAMMELGEQAEGAVLRHGARELSQVILGSESESDEDDLEREDRVLSAAVSTDALDKFARYRVAHERAFFAAFDRLREMQAERKESVKRVNEETQPERETFATEQACEDYLASRFRSVDWRCPYCQHPHGSWLQRQKRWECGACHKQIGLRFGTVMERSQLPLQVWFQALGQLRKFPGTSTTQLMEILGITRRGTVRALAQRITEAMATSEANQLLAGIESQGDDQPT